MQWRTIRLDRNHRLGRIGDLVEAPEPTACEMIRDGRAEPAGAVSLTPHQPGGDIFERWLLKDRELICTHDGPTGHIDIPPEAGARMMARTFEKMAEGWLESAAEVRRKYGIVLAQEEGVGAGD